MGNIRRARLYTISQKKLKTLTQDTILSYNLFRIIHMEGKINGVKMDIPLQLQLSKHKKITNSIANSNLKAMLLARLFYI